MKEFMYCEYCHRWRWSKVTDKGYVCGTCFHEIDPNYNPITITGEIEESGNESVTHDPTWGENITKEKLGV